MDAVRQLGKEDILFVAGENDTVYQHTAGLVVLDTSDCPDFSFELLKERVIERIAEVPHFRWKLHEVPLGLDLPYWVEDENFRYDNHFKRIALPTPGDREALSEVVAHLYSHHLDRSKPLWEFWFIEGLENGKCAILQKLHHCMMDGQGASKLGELLCDFEPNAEPRPVDPAISGASAGEVPDTLKLSAKTALHLARLPVVAYRELLGFAGPKILEKIGLREKLEKRPRPDTPQAIFNGEVSSDRGFVFGSLSLDDIKTVKNAFDASINDVILVLVATALRDYLLARDQLPELALRTGMPVSLRSEGDDDFSNRVTQVPVTLATDIADPLDRLRAISEDCRQAKELAHGGGKGMIEFLQIMPPLMVSALMATTSPDQAAQMLGSNLIVSNVRGSNMPMYLAGARLETMYPMSIITSGLGLNFTCISYVDQVDVGIALEPNLVPEPWEIIDGMASALTRYVKLAGKARPRRKVAAKSGKTASRSKAAARAKTAPRKKAVAGKKTSAAKTAGAKAKSATAKRSTGKRSTAKHSTAKHSTAKQATRTRRS